MEEAKGASSHPNIQADALALLAEMGRPTQGTSTPVMLEDLDGLHMSEEHAKAAFQYLKSKRLIEANFSVHYAARLSASGHDALLAVNKSERQQPVETEPKAAEMFTLKPGIWGMSVDLKEVARRLSRQFKKS